MLESEYILDFDVQHMHDFWPGEDSAGLASFQMATFMPYGVM